MNKTKIFCFFLIAALAAPAFAELTVKLTPPEYTGTGIYAPDGALGDVVPGLNEALKETFGRFEDDIRGELGEFGNVTPNGFIGAWGNSSVFSSHGATQRGYAGYNRFAVTLGPMIGIQIPSSPFDIINEVEGIDTTLKDKGDIKIGLNPQLMTGQLGFNTSWVPFLKNLIPLENFYVGVQFGYMSLNGLAEGLSFSTASFGLRANYQIIDQKKLPFGLLVWRGVNLGSGIIYQNTSVGISFDMSQFDDSGQTTVQNIGTPVTLDPVVGMNLDINTVTIPLEAVTSVKLVFLNLSLGLGADLSFGSSRLGVGLDTNIDVDIRSLYDPNQYSDPSVTGELRNQGEIVKTKEGHGDVNIGGSVSPSFFNMKLMTGVGFTFGPVIIDIPFTYYFIDNGFSVGFTVGVAL